MKKILLYLSFLWVILFMGSCATKKICQSDLTQISQSDSAFIFTECIDSGSYIDRTVHIYDSVITHITIYRYDTIITSSGDPVLKEKIEIDQTKIQNQEDLTQSRDSTKIFTHIETDVTKNDSIHKEQIIIKGPDKKSKIFTFSIIILFLALMVEICSIGINILRNK